MRFHLPKYYFGKLGIIAENGVICLKPKKMRQKHNNDNWYQQQLEFIDVSLNDIGVIVRKIDTFHNYEISIAYLDGLIDKNLLQRDVIGAILRAAQVPKDIIANDLLSIISLSTASITEVSSSKQLEDQILQGNTILLIETLDKGYSLELKGWPKRTTQEPEIETSVRGAHLGFTEIIGENIALVRRYIKSKSLKEKNYILGTNSKTPIKLLYFQGAARAEVVEEVIARLDTIHLEVIMDSGYIEQLIVDNPYSPFPQAMRTERPDKVAANLLDGKVAILVDGSPTALLLPAPMIGYFQTIDEFSTQWLLGSVLRLIRWIGFFVAMFLPAIYIAIVSKDFSIMPLQLLLIIAESRAGIPYPPLVEALIMEITVEIIREAGIRLPGKIGQTIGIVGAIVIGDAAVKAGIASNIMIIVVAVTTISTFLVPVFELGLAVRFIRFFMMFLGGTFGIIGLSIGGAMVLAHLSMLETCGVPYLEPFAPIKVKEWKDLFIRAPLWTMNGRRPTPSNKRRK